MGNCVSQKQSAQNKKRNSQNVTTTSNSQNNIKQSQSKQNNQTTVSIDVVVEWEDVGVSSQLINSTSGSQGSKEYENKKNVVNKVFELPMNSFDTVGILKFSLYQLTKIAPKNQILILLQASNTKIGEDQQLNKGSNISSLNLIQVNSLQSTQKTSNSNEFQEVRTTDVMATEDSKYYNKHIKLSDSFMTLKEVVQKYSPDSPSMLKLKLIKVQKKNSKPQHL